MFGCKCKRFTKEKDREFELGGLKVNPYTIQVEIENLKYSAKTKKFSDLVTILDILLYNRCLIFTKSMEKDLGTEYIKEWDAPLKNLIETIQQQIHPKHEDLLLMEVVSIMLLIDNKIIPEDEILPCIENWVDVNSSKILNLAQTAEIIEDKEELDVIVANFNNQHMEMGG